jgi:hypothetical protein
MTSERHEEGAKAVGSDADEDGGREVECPRLDA